MEKEDKNEIYLEELKLEYDKLGKKYELPEFSELNKLFDVEEIDPQSEFLLRRVRRAIAEKIEGYLRFAEVILNPSNAPIFFFKLIKKLDNSDKENLTKIYGIFANLEMEMIMLDLDYEEKKESDFIKKLFKVFNEDIRTKLLEIVKKMTNGSENNKKNGTLSYFG